MLLFSADFQAEVKTREGTFLFSGATRIVNHINLLSYRHTGVCLLIYVVSTVWLC